jgi:hypothetical protein
MVVRIGEEGGGYFLDEKKNIIMREEVVSSVSLPS